MKALVAGAMVLGSALPAMAGSNLITNGSFDAQTMNGTTYTGSSQLNGYGGYAGGTNLTGWTNTGYSFVYVPGPGTSGSTADTTGAGNLEYTPPTGGTTMTLWGPGANGGGVSNGLTESPVGTSFVAIDGAFGNTLSQSVSNLVVGYQYQLQFYWAAAQQYDYSGATTDDFVASFSDGTTTSSYTTTTDNNASHGFTPWQLVTTTFKATSTTEVLSFVAQGAPNGDPPFALLDGVSLAAVPEPASWAAMVSALIGVAGGARLIRRRKLAA